jgi:hypothetical protein
MSSFQQQLEEFENNVPLKERRKKAKENVDAEAARELKRMGETTLPATKRRPQQFRRRG